VTETEPGPALAAGTGATRRAHGRAVLAVAVVFTASGVAMASAVSRMPQIKLQVQATTTELAFALVCVGIGSVVAMPFAGRMVQRFSTAGVCRTFAAVALIGWSLVPLARSVPELAAILLFTGAGVGVWDVAMNVQGSIVERRRGQVLMPLWHGLFSVGGVVGAIAGAGAARWGVALGWQLPVVAGVLLVIVLAECARFLPNPAPDPPASSASHPAVADDAPGGAQPGAAGAAGSGTAATPRSPSPVRSSITRTELLLGLITLGTALGEGAANDWLAIALVDGRGAPAAIGALTYAGFNLTMAIGRFCGGPLIARFGRVPALRTAGLIAAGGIVLLCLMPGAGIALVAALAWGLGLAIVFPSAMSAAGEVPGRGGRAIATVSTIGYGGFLLGAPMIGLLSHVMPLLRALLAVAAFAILIVVLAPAARERHEQPRVVGRG
jgi:MFS family permease